ncbi:FtsX-like permease family protein [compost metagenome]
MMFPNSNKPIVKRLTSRSLKANRTRNRFVIIAIVLTTWLITSFFSIGLSNYKTFEMQQLKINGTMADAYLTSPSERQLNKLKELSYIKTIGLQSRVANIINTPEMGDLNLALIWYDSTEWTEMRKPVIDGLKGKYPEKDNEIAVPLWILQSLGIDDPQIGMSLPFTYSVSRDGVKSQESNNFVLSGWFTDYSHVRTGNTGAMLVSGSFATAHGIDLKKPKNAAILFNEKNTDELISRLQQDITLEKSQKLDPVSYMSSTSSDRTATLIGYAGIILFVMLSGYLLIYNVLYISVSRDTRFYGLLRTLGTTQRQIKKIVRAQASRLALIAIPLGLVAGAVTSFVLVPLAMSTAEVDTGVEISFHPLIFIGAALFAWLTTMFSAIKPASIAGKVSPIEAVRYTGIMVKNKKKKGTSGSKLHRLAWRNIFRVKKRAMVVFLSLFLGLTTFLVINTLVLSMSTDHFIAEYMDNDFTLSNQTMSLGFEGEEKAKISEDMIKDIQEMKGVKEVFKAYIGMAEMKYDPKVFGKYVDEFAKSYHTERPADEQLAKGQGMFSMTRVTGLDPDHVKKLEEKLGFTVDMERFEKGEIALLDNFSLGGLAIGDPFQISPINSGAAQSFEIGGLSDFGSLGSAHFVAPNLYISHTAMEKFMKDPHISKVYMNADPKDWKQITDQLEGLIGGDSELKLESKLYMEKLMESAKLTFYIMGGGIALILALIGILNYINIMYTGVVARKLEFAVMESIGMTSKQMRKLLLFEGAGYAIISTLLISIIGTSLSYGAYSLFSQEATYAVFSFPTIPLSIAIVLVFAVCLSVPLIAYKQIKKDSIVERLRQME